MTLSGILGNQVHSPEDAIDVNALWFSWLKHWLVVNSQIVDDVWIWVFSTVHPLESSLGDVCDFITVGGVIGDDCSVRARNNQ